MTAVQWLTKAEYAFAAAELLLERGYQDAAASRMYYGYFFVTTALVSGGDRPLRSHRHLMSQFAVHFTQPGLIDKRFHALLVRAFAARQDADYALDQTP
jgi:uncharacterized protein (UPF0332 family)